MTVHDLCKSTTLPARFYRVSECTFCKQMASSADSKSQLFGDSTTVMHISTTPALSLNFDDLLFDPRSNMADFYAQNDFYEL